jgi:glutamate-1-semialdehyde 2,1-aminomutase
MDHILPAGKVFQAGTLSGNPLATAAGIATLKILRDENPYPQLEKLSARLVAGLHSAAESAGVPHRISACGSMLTFFFAKEDILDWPSASRCDIARYAKYFWNLIEHGIYMPCSQFEALFLSTAHTEADIDATIAAARF